MENVRRKKNHSIDRNAFLALLRELLLTHSPSGDEAEMESKAKRELSKWCDRVWMDAADNIIGMLKGKSRENPLRIMAHKDEIGLIVKRLEDDGRLRVEPLGGACPWRYGEGPMDILADSGILTGILSVGSSHTSPEAADVHQALSKPLDWDMVRIDTRLGKEDLIAKGVQTGTRVVVSRTRKEPTLLSDYICGWGLDDKAGVAILLTVAEQLAKKTVPLKRDVYFVVTTAEETGIQGGAYAARALPGDETVGIEIAPVHREYGIQNTSQPVVFYKDTATVYSKKMADRFYRLGKTLGFGCQAIVASSFGSDASVVLKYGLSGQAACLGFPTDNTHGYEIASITAMENLVKLLIENEHK
jgi:putative aminopeptidase FrvX